MFPRPVRCSLLAILLLCTLANLAHARPESARAPEPRVATSVPTVDLPHYLPRYRVEMDLDVANHLVRVVQTATWINPTPIPTDRLVLNVHSRYVVPQGEVGFMAKMLEILRVQPSEALGYKEPPCQINSVHLARTKQALAYRIEGDTHTTVVLPLPAPVGPGESVTVVLDLTFHIPARQGRWGQWEGVTQLSNWLPVFAYYGPGCFGPAGRPGYRQASPEETGVRWQPTPFIPWHQPFFNEAGIYEVSANVPADHEVACTGQVLATTPLPQRRKRLDIQALGVREFTLIASARFQVFEDQVRAGVHGTPVRIRILAFPEHEFYARHMLRIASESLLAYSKWFGPYPWPVFSIAETYFGWNGNECSTLVMIDERVFAMPHVGVGYVEYLVSHEICHQWWYNLIGTNGFCETWMDESLANYFSHYLLTWKLGQKNNNLMSYPSWLEWLPNVRRDDYRACGMYGTFGRGENMPVIQEMPKFGHLVNLFNMCYDKGGRIIGMIADRLQERAFLDFIHLLAERYKYRILSVADFRRELEEYTGQDWTEFFERWLYSKGLSDWSVEKVTITRPPQVFTDPIHTCLWKKKLLLARAVRGNESRVPRRSVDDTLAAGTVRLQIWINQKAEYDEPTVLGIALRDQEGYPLRIRILPQAGNYQCDEPLARVTALEPNPKGGVRMLVEVVVPGEPTQVAIDPDQVLVDRDPTNNYWHTPIRWRFAPLYTFLEESDLTNAYDRWNIIFGPWMYAPAYENAWFTLSPMVGVRAGAYRTQEFYGGAYAAYRTTFRDVVVGVDGLWDHWPFPRSQVGYTLERRVAESNDGDTEAKRAVVWGRYVFTYGSSLYMPPMHYLETFAEHSDNFLPFVTQKTPTGIRYDRTTTLGLHYRLNYLTPYWDPEGGFRFDAWYEGGIAQEPATVGVQKLASLFSCVQSAPDLRPYVADSSTWHRLFGWLADTRLAMRIYGATASPAEGEFFSMGGSDLFRGFDLAQRQGSSVWVGSLEWRLPLARRVHWDVLDHVASLRNVYTAFFYDVGDIYTNHHSLGGVAHGVGMGLRLDVSWFSFVERTTLRFDVAKAINADTGVQVWLGVNHPF